MGGGMVSPEVARVHIDHVTRLEPRYRDGPAMSVAFEHPLRLSLNQPVANLRLESDQSIEVFGETVRLRTSIGFRSNLNGAEWTSTQGGLERGHPRLRVDSVVDSEFDLTKDIPEPMLSEVDIPLELLETFSSFLYVLALPAFLRSACKSAKVWF